VPKEAYWLQVLRHFGVRWVASMVARDSLDYSEDQLPLSRAFRAMH